MSENREGGGEFPRIQIRLFENVIVYFDETFPNGQQRPRDQEENSQPQQESNATEPVDEGILLHRIASKVDAGKVGAMRDIYNLSVPPNAQCSGSTATDLLKTMRENGYVSRRDLIFLQCLLWETGQKDLFEEVGGIGKKLRRGDDKVVFFFMPSFQPTRGFYYIHLHVKDKFSIHAQEDSQRMLANILNVPEECMKLAGVLPSNSFWLTFEVPESAFSTFLTSLLKTEKSSLNVGNVDKISFLQTILPTDIEKWIVDSDSEEEESAWGQLTKAGEGAGCWLTYAVPADALSGMDVPVLGKETVAKMEGAKVDKISFVQTSPLLLPEPQAADAEKTRPSSQEVNHESTSCSSSRGRNGMVTSKIPESVVG